MVSSSGHRCRFISAIWNSYSKSDTARSPRMIMRASCVRAKRTSRPVKSATTTRGSSANTLRIRSSRSRIVEDPALALRAAVRDRHDHAVAEVQRAPRTMSSWPRVMGSKDPG
jgi:hypothetical protein